MATHSVTTKEVYTVTLVLEKDEVLAIRGYLKGGGSLSDELYQELYSAFTIPETTIKD